MHRCFIAITVGVFAFSAAASEEGDAKLASLAKTLHRSEQLIAAAIRTSDINELRAQSKVTLAVADQILEYRDETRYDNCLNSAINLTKIAIFSRGDLTAEKYIELDTAKREFPGEMAACEKLLGLSFSLSPNLR